MPQPEPESAEPDRERIAARVLARLPHADRERARVHTRQRRQRLAALLAGLLGLSVCLVSASSNMATHSLAWALAADTAWGAIVRILLGGLGFLPALSAACMSLAAFLLWHRLIHAQNRGVR